MNTQELYQNAIKYAAMKHGEQNQKVPGSELPYLVHVCNVAMEISIAASQSIDFNAGFALQVALLHDTMEDTSATYEDLTIQFGEDVANAVFALTKNASLPKSEKMEDSLIRIKQQPKEVAAVKLADRITNLQPPPEHWPTEKRIKYQNEAYLILSELGYANDYLANRLKECIKQYSTYI